MAAAGVNAEARYGIIFGEHLVDRWYADGSAELSALRYREKNREGVTKQLLRIGNIAAFDFCAYERGAYDIAVYFKRRYYADEAPACFKKFFEHSAVACGFCAKGKIKSAHGVINTELYKQFCKFFGGKP